MRIKQQRIENAKNTIICHLSINSIRNKFNSLDEIVKAFDVFLISESKLDNTFPINQFSIRGYKVFRRDRNRFGGGLILYVNENIPCKPLTDHPVFSDLELMAFELHQSKRKWLLLGIYKPPSQNVIEFLNRISLIIDYYLQTYENILAIGDFNLSVDNSHLEAFMQAYDFSSLIKKPTCYQSNTPSCIDLILTNRKSLFKLSNTFETGLSDHHKLVCTILKSGGFKGAPIEKIYRSYKTFDVSNFKNTLKIELEKVKSESYGEFEAVFLKELNKHAPLKKKFLRHSNNPFMTKDLRNQIMVRAKLRNIFNKNRNYEKLV